MKMNTNLSAHSEDLLRQCLAKGHRTQEEVVKQALEMLAENGIRAEARERSILSIGDLAKRFWSVADAQKYVDDGHSAWND